MQNNEYCLYLRKSRKDIEAEARGEGETLARHENILLSLAKTQKLNITKIYKEVVSGESIASRPVMQQLLADIESGIWAGILVVEVERLARGDTMDQGIVAQTFKYSNCKIITPVKTYDPQNEFDEEYFEYGLFMSRREYKTINRRMQGGRIQSVKEGKFVGNKTAYGYRKIKIQNQKGYSLEPVPEEAEIIKMIFELYTVGEKQPDGSLQRLGLTLIANKINRLKIPPKFGDAWTTGTLQNLIRNPVYTGKIRWNGRPTVKKMIDGQMVTSRPRAKKEDWILVDGLHEAIISEEIFNRAQELIEDNPSRPCPKQYTIKNPLAGIVKCGLCGRNMVRRPYNDVNKTPDTLMCPQNTCKNISSYLSIVEDHVIRGLENWLKNYKLSFESASRETDVDSGIKAISKALDKINKEIKEIEQQMNKTHDLLEQGIYNIDTFLERNKLLNERLKSTADDKLDLENELKQKSNIVLNQKTLVPKIEKVLDLYRASEDPAIKNEILKEVLDKVVYIKRISGRYSRNPDEFELTLYPKLPKV